VIPAAALAATLLAALFGAALGGGAGGVCWRDADRVWSVIRYRGRFNQFFIYHV
jgi:hypothetical protein